MDGDDDSAADRAAPAGAQFQGGAPLGLVEVGKQPGAASSPSAVRSIWPLSTGSHMRTSPECDLKHT
jgi:hypothetical protein